MRDYEIQIDNGPPYKIGEDILVGPLQPAQPGLSGISFCTVCGEPYLTHDLQHCQTDDA